MNVDVKKALQEFLDAEVSKLLDKVGEQSVQQIKNSTTTLFKHKKINKRQKDHIIDRIKSDKKENKVTISCDSDHAQYVELGTYKMAKIPFMEPVMKDIGSMLKEGNV